jgi:hypothetical protein
MLPSMVAFYQRMKNSAEDEGGDSAPRPVVNVGSIAGDPVDSPRMIGLASSDSRRGRCPRIVVVAQPARLTTLRASQGS